MIAQKSDVARVGRHAPGDPVDHAGAVGPAVHIVAEINDAPVGGPVADDLALDQCQHLRQQIGTAVDVADGVKAHAFGRAGVLVSDARLHPSLPTTMMCSARGPCAPSSSFCSMSPEREGPVIMFTVRGIWPLPNVSRTRGEHGFEVARDILRIDDDEMMLGQEVDRRRIVRARMKHQRAGFGDGRRRRG